MFFRLTNSLATFQMMINDLFKELIDKGVVTIYMDDILIFGGQTQEQHHGIVVRVLNILHKHCLYLKVESAPLNSQQSSTSASSYWKAAQRWTQFRWLASETGRHPGM